MLLCIVSSCALPLTQLCPNSFKAPPFSVRIIMDRSWVIEIMLKEGKSEAKGNVQHNFF